MCVSSALIGFVAGILSGIAVELLGYFILRFWTRPALRVAFDSADNSCVEPTFTADGTPCHYISVRTSNRGLTTGKNFRGFLVRIERRDGDGNWVRFASDVIQLKWA